MKTQTNETTTKILDWLLDHKIYCWRNSVGGMKTEKGYYQLGKPGSSDIIAVLPPAGRFLGIEIKTGKDKLRPEQIGFQRNIEQMGGIYMVVHTFEDFLTKYQVLLTL